jgi:translation initiation factor 1
MRKKKLYNLNTIVYSTDSNFATMQKTAGEATIPAEEQLLKVRLDTKHRGGKVVTLIDGFVGDEADLEQLGKELKSYCGTGGSAKNKQVIIQGDHKEKIFQWLIKRGYKQTTKI